MCFGPLAVTASDLLNVLYLLPVGRGIAVVEVTQQEGGCAFREHRGRGQCPKLHAVMVWGGSLTGVRLICVQLACRATGGTTASE